MDVATGRYLSSGCLPGFRLRETHWLRILPLATALSPLGDKGCQIVGVNTNGTSKMDARQVAAGDEDVDGGAADAKAVGHIGDAEQVPVGRRRRGGGHDGGQIRFDVRSADQDVVVEG
jgi:hypothetical protein